MTSSICTYTFRRSWGESMPKAGVKVTWSSNTEEPNLLGTPVTVRRDSTPLLVQLLLSSVHQSTGTASTATTATVISKSVTRKFPN